MKRALILGAAAAAALLAAAFAGAYWLTVLTLAVITMLACLSIVVLTGWSGQLNLHVAALGLGWGAYAAFALSSIGVPPTLALLGAAVATIPFAIAVGAVAARFRGLELAVATLAIGLVFERLAFRNIGKLLTTGGSTFGSSFVSVGRPSFADGDAGFFLFCAAVVFTVFAVVDRVGRSGTGRALAAIKEREAAAETLGIPVLRYRVGAFAASIAIAGCAGALLASLKLGVAPDNFTIDLSFQILAAAVIGGIASPAGAIIGGALIAVLPEATQFGPFKLFAGERLFLLFGAGMILTLWRRPKGLASLLAQRTVPPAEDAAPLRASEEIVRPDPATRTRRPTLLRTAGISVRFGGLVALDGVDLSVREAEIAAVIGPNGAGKSTLFNVVGGLIEPGKGRVYFEGRDITELSPSRRAKAGIARTFQSIEVFREMTVRQNLSIASGLLAAPSALHEALSLPSARRAERTRGCRAEELLTELGLQDVAEHHAADLPLGRLRVLEAGMTLASAPKLLLLDEPSAGLDEHETRALGTIILSARAERGISVLIVEHDMSLVRQLADHVIVLDFGRVIAEGTPDAVRHDPLVIERYLGADLDEELLDAHA